MKRNNPIWLLSFLCCVVYFGVSFSVERERADRVNLEFSFGRLPGLQAGEDAWGFVRQSATWARGNSSLIDELIMALKNAGLLDRPAGTYDFTDLNIDGVPVKMRVGVNQNYTLGASAFEAGDKTFANKVVFWRAVDNVKMLELFFDRAGDLSGDGALLMYRLNAFDAKFSNPDAIVESYAFVDSSGNRRQTYSWSGPLIQNEITSRGRVVLIEMGDTLCVQSVITLNSAHASGQLCGPGNNYYSLAYGVKIAAPHQTTALFGLRQGAVDNSGTVCGVTNHRNFGRFERGGFLGDGFAASEIPADAPPSTAVSTIFGQLGTDPAATDCGGDCDGDDTGKTTIDGLSSAVRFRDTSSPP